MAPDVVWDDEASSSPDVVWDDQPAGGDVPAGEAMGAGEMKILPFGTQLGALEDVAKRRLAKGAVEVASGHGLGAAASAALAPGAVEEYRQARDARTELADRAKETSPVPYYTGTALGLAGQVFLPGGGAKSLGGSIGQGAAYGAAAGLSDSKADLTRGEVGQAALDTGIGALAGGAAGALGHGIGKVIGRIAAPAREGGIAANKIRLANADQALAEYGDRYAAQKSAQGAFGGEAAAVQNRVAHWREIAQNLEGRYSVGEVAQAQRLLASPEANEAIRRAGVNSMKEGGNRMVEGLQSAENVYDAARGAMDPDAIAAGAEAGMQHPIRDAVLPRVQRYLGRAVPAAVGGMFGGVPGAIAGSLVGAAIGKPGTSIANLMKNPAARRMAWGLVESGSSALGRFGPYLQRVATTGGVELAREIHERLLDSDSDYQAKVARGLQDASQVEPLPEGP